MYKRQILEIPCEEFGSVKMPGIFPVLSETPGEVKWAGPKIGAHNRAIYGGLLGKNEEELRALAEAGAI